MNPLLEQRLQSHVNKLALDIGERNVYRPTALHVAADYIRTTWQQLGYEVHTQGYYAKGVWSENLEIEITGSTSPGEIILAGAHYDSVTGSPGADDNASGIAALLEIARLLSGSQPARTLRLVAFVNEEPPFFYFGAMGSKIYAQAARARNDDIRMMLSLEMLGYYSDQPGSQAYPPCLHWFYPDHGNFIGFVSNLKSRQALKKFARAFAARSDFPFETLTSPAFVPGVAWSDQISFWHAGYQAIMVTDTAFYRNPHYHRASDTPEKLSYTPMARVVDGLANALATLVKAQ
ncbi:Peptidase family M28 [Nitrosomonas nitrosa]|uniref:Peptidase family M28 n=1 Tax=Nitrosomonas nitrosa TaxID=52442 RepID=A0A1I4Q290_9PROT|nr:M28 family peptidase [Nitrosomonas nitrosa]CAE6514192.1 Peptidase family M28 [Nitrosomonas nitrosa]SFM33755.1 Peptidase family M28 [Nitrosomonas nitrosa]